MAVEFGEDSAEVPQVICPSLAVVDAKVDLQTQTANTRFER